MAPKGGGKKGPRAYKLPDTIPAGEVLIDLYKKQWKLGDPVGQGGFGMIYLADVNKPGKVEPDAQYVIKIEPHENGPLFVELHFYQRAAKADKVDAWRKKNKLSHLGVPKFIGAGNHEHGKSRYRFMVMQRFGEDLWKKFNALNKRFSIKTTFTLGIQVMNCLEYLHDNEYCHADIKSSNMLLGYGSGKSQDQAYLVDYGLAHRYMPDGKHKDYKEDPRKAHDGTAEFTSRDAHKGVTPSRRADLEILGYNLVEWLTGSLPWYDRIGDCNYVMQQKIKYMGNISSFLTKCFPSGGKPAELKQYLEYVQKLGYTDKPDYNKIRTLFKKAIVNAGFKDDGKLEFAQAAAASRTASPKKAARAASPKKAARAASPKKAARSASPKKAAPKRGPRASNKAAAAAKSPTRRKRKTSDDESDEMQTPPKKAKGRSGAALRSPPKTPQQRKMLQKINAANSTASPAVKRTRATKPLTNGGTPASTKKSYTVKRKRKKADSSNSSTQTTPGLERNAKKSR